MEKVIALLEKRGPFTGKELVRETGLDIFSAWKFCAVSKLITVRIIGRRYLRLDKKVEGYARLSPSIMREFLNYTVIGINNQRPAVEEQAAKLEAEIAAISRKKIDLAGGSIKRLLESHPDRNSIVNSACFLIAGDVVFNMAHAEPRPESSTGELVRGSDLDVIVVAEDLSEKQLKKLDALLYKEKFNLLMNPASKEEMDYIVKSIKTVKEQLRFDSFRAMVASKILHEALFLYGNPDLFDRIKQMVVESAVPEKILELKERAWINREQAEKSLLDADDSADREQLMALFYTTEEKEEIF